MPISAINPSSLSMKKLTNLFHLSEATIQSRLKKQTLLPSYQGLYEITGKLITLDKDIAEVISLLNSKRYITMSSCAGHDFSSNERPYITFVSSTITEEDFPIGVIGIYYDLREQSTTLYFKNIHDLLLDANLDDYISYLDELHQSLLTWATNLKDKTMRTYNVSKDKVNYSQRNNEVNPSKSCNTTSMVMAASYLPTVWEKFISSELYKKYSKKFKQPEDCLQQYMLDVGLRPTYHAELSKAMNDFCGSKVTKFSMTVTLATLVKELKEGRPVVISGDFPKSDGKTLGHVVCLVGCVFNNDNKTNVPDYWIIDDPYGDTMNDWTGSGNDIKLTHEYFMKYIKEKGQGKKWGHTFLV